MKASGFARAFGAFRDVVAANRAELRLATRVTVAALVTYVLSVLLNVPQVLWTVLTAVIMSQLSVGKSVKTTLDYFAGTFGGALWSGLVSASVPHGDMLSFSGVLILAIGPLAVLAALRPRFSAGPFTAVMVLFAPTLLHVSPAESALYRVIEVLLGGVVALAVSFLVLPSRAHTLGVEAASRMLRRMAGALRQLLAGCAEPLDPVRIAAIQTGLGPAVAQLEILADEALRERSPYGGSESPLQPLLRIVLRLRHDLVIIGRAAAAPLPPGLCERLLPQIGHVAETASAFLEDSAAALVARAPPPLDKVEAALEAYDAEIGAYRAEGHTRALDVEALERLFALGFALDQLRQDLNELSRYVAARQAEA